MIYRDVCRTKISRDHKLTGEFLQRWQKWEKALLQELKIPRAMVEYRQAIKCLELHGFGDGSTQGIDAVVIQ